MMRSRAYWILSPGVGEIRAARGSDDAVPDGATVIVETLRTGISIGTERMVGLGRVPPDCFEPMRCPYMRGSFRFPLKYGYCAIGVAANGPHRGKTVFVMHPHEDCLRVRAADLVPVPAAIPVERATLIPNLETACNAVWDAELDHSSRIAVVGGGGVGVLTAFAVEAMHGARATMIESDPARRRLHTDLSWIARSIEPNDAARDEYTHVFHTSGTAEGMQLALDLLAFEGRLIEISWFGDREVTLRLGASFHYRRKRIVSSQVSSVAAPVRATISRGDRLDHVIRLLADERLDRVPGPVIPFEELPRRMREIYGGATPGLAPVVTYC